MITLSISNKKYNLPTRLTIKQWKSLVGFDFNDESQWHRILGSLIGMHPRDLELADRNSMILAISFIISIMNGRAEYKVKDFNTLLFGEFVDLDVYVVQGIEKNMETIVEMLTPEGDEPTVWSDEAMWLIDRYTQFRIHTYRSYAGLFGLNDLEEYEDIEDDEDHDPNGIAKGWYKVIIGLADNNIEKIDYVTEQPLKKVLNFMSHRKEVQLEENAKVREQQRKLAAARNK
tara:strand:- start:5663 stop:6355 length:693 start_codon:yes stop_codon:yes gene_type:complete